ncbi:sigma-70 family RNA polymerase sigma factor [Pseudoalteromonas sp. SMS1]|uniref:sigma-70 family RNA polymerase sigma factor n=1 Tax=Pseudoalteromonas sp. SMS1 TaxID=2908894 RepID=UPI001F16B50D|nr:sigma-70 family RNA polymerase sigma factor [Pseudoalteromonas sp. SMS1]MCF2859277.1 sigma-70 family RNA polymerase sigma factor [Pseudoalteromonas sp. SMS1]
MQQLCVKWSKVIAENEAKLLAYLNNILRCPYLAEDALQDTFIRLSGMSKCQDCQVKNTKSYCYQVARNIAIDMIRKQNRESLVDLESIQTEHFDDESSNVEEKYIDAQLSDKVNSTISKLSQRHQNVVSFYRDGRLKQKEIAKMYHISPTLVNFMIKEAIQSCQNELQAGAVAH